MFIDIIRCLRGVVRRRRPEKWRTNSWVPLHANAPAHRSVLVKDFLAQNNVTTLEHPPYCPNLVAANFHLLPPLKSAFKVHRVYIATDIIRNATYDLKRLSQYGYQECFQHLIVAGRSVYLHKETILKEMWLTSL
jgi:hypothetical protein